MKASDVLEGKNVREKRLDLIFRPVFGLGFLFLFALQYRSCYFFVLCLLYQIVTSMIFLVFGTGALNALRLFYFKKIFENEHIIAYTHLHYTTQPNLKQKKLKHFISMFFEA